MSLKSRLARLEALTAKAEDAGAFLGSARFWAALHQPWPHHGLTAAERAELRPLFFPSADAADPVEAAIAAMEARQLR